MSDELYDGRRIRVLTLVDNHTRESLAIQVSQRIRGIDVVQILEGLVKQHDRPKTIQVDNGPEFISKDLDLFVLEIFLMATMLGAGILYGYFLQLATGELTNNIDNCSWDSPINLNPTLIKLLNCSCTHSAGNHSVNLLTD